MLEMLDAAVTVQGNIKGSPTSSLIARRGRLPAILPRYRCAWVSPSLPT